MKRGVVIKQVTNYCDEDQETKFHLFGVCQVMRDVWKDMFGCKLMSYIGKRKNKIRSYKTMSYDARHAVGLNLLSTLKRLASIPKHQRCDQVLSPYH